ncbi:MAG: aminoacyl-tRNA hydrolase [Syntrophales bacterium]|nr:aminoacyl-tRNA hydrolase [Syntrophales bacterium]
MKLIVGLGNPGLRYEMTRHNMGFLTIDRLTEDYGIEITQRGFQSLYGKGKFEDTQVILAKPQTYMNLSGQAVKKLFDYFKLNDSSNLIVIHDDLDLPFGTLRIRARGGHGGHRGLMSVIEHMGTSNFIRLRMGIGRPPVHIAADEYVLDRFSPVELDQLESLLKLASEAVFLTVTSGVETAMNKYNGKAIN